MVKIEGLFSTYMLSLVGQGNKNGVYFSINMLSLKGQGDKKGVYFSTHMLSQAGVVSKDKLVCTSYKRAPAWFSYCLNRNYRHIRGYRERNGNYSGMQREFFSETEIEPEAAPNMGLMASAGGVYRASITGESSQDD